MVPEKNQEIRQIFLSTTEVTNTFKRESLKLFSLLPVKLTQHTSRSMFCATVAKTALPNVMKSLLKDSIHNLLFEEYFANDLSIFKEWCSD